MVAKNIDKEDCVVIQLPSKVISLHIKDFSDCNIDTEELLQIQYYNVWGEIITWAVVFNRISNIKAEMDNYLRESEFDFKAFEAQLYTEHRKSLLGHGEKATEAAIDMAIKRDPKYKVKKFELLNIQKQADIVDGLYWSAKSKGRMLEAISAKIKPEEFEKEILEGTVNDVLVKVHKNNFANKR
jgi:trehalose/maltose hydrolase-like predicted phosphorylase